MNFDCIIVLANEMDIEGNLNAESLARITLGCDQYFKRPVTMITCGWDYRKDSPLFIGAVLKDYAVKLGVPADKILAELNSRDTVGDAFFTKNSYVKSRGWKNLLVVTTDYHVNRTSRIFNFIYGPDYVIEVIGAPGFDNADKQHAERKSLEAFERTFENVSAGDDRAIYARLSTRHPFYNGEIYSRLTLDIQ
jgi:uncharacterized SAM-binding protein YcdF (DUF218 family)